MLPLIRKQKKPLDMDIRMKTGLSLLIVLFILGAFELAAAQQQPAPLPLDQILHKADSVATLQDSLLAHAKYKVKENVVFSELNDKGEIKNSDTIISDITIQDKKEVSRDVVYSTRKSKSEGKKDQSETMGFYFKFNDPNYNFSLTGTTDSTYIIAVSPKAAPKKGDLKGTIEIDRQNFYSRVIDIEVPQPEGALKEFTTWVKFEPLEGGLVVITDVKTKGLATAMLGIFKMRFSGEVKYSDYQMLK